MNIPALFSTADRVRILQSCLFREKLFGVSEVAREARVSKALVSRLFGVLAREKLVRRKRGKFVVSPSSGLRAVRVLLTVTRIPASIFRRHAFVKAAGMYGSGARGENTASSDVDIWVCVGKADDTELASLAAEIRRAVPQVSLLLLTDEKLMHLKENEQLLYHSIHFGSLILFGDGREV